MNKLLIVSADEAAILPPEKKLFSYDKKLGYWDIYWGGYEYSIEDARIKTPEHLLAWVIHLGEKEWGSATSWRIGKWVEAVCKHKGWKHWKTG